MPLAAPSSRWSRDADAWLVEEAAPQVPKAAAPPTPFAQQMSQFRLPDENTPVLTGLLESSPNLEAKALPISNVAGASKGGPSLPWGERPLWRHMSPSSDNDGYTLAPATPTTTAGHSSPCGSPCFGSPSLSAGCHTDSCDVSPAGKGICQSPADQEARIQQAQSLFARMLSSHPKGQSKRRRSEPPHSTGSSTSIATAPSGSRETRPSRRCLSCKPGRGGAEESPAAEVPRLQPLNGSMPQFPPAVLASTEQQALASRMKRIPVKPRDAG